MQDGAKAYGVTVAEYGASSAGEIALDVGVAPVHASSEALSALRAYPGVADGNFDTRVSKSYYPVKRLVDVIFSCGFLLAGGAWMFPIIAILIKLDSRGPVFFLQERVGYRGQTFRCLKFRTMTHNPQASFVQAQKDDPRVTRVGRFLRKTNLDELPQFINVLKGEMSVVGPRPHVQELDIMHGDQVRGYRLRNTVRPGVTGLAQISGCRGETRSVRDMEHRVRFDLFYVRNMSLMLDVKIILLTIVRVIQGDSRAY